MRLGRDVDEHRVAAPLLRLEAELGHLRAHAVGLRAFLVDLVDRDDDRHVGRLRVVDGLAGLRAHAVVGGDHDHGDVRRLGAAGTHGGERLVARGVQERDDLVVLVDLVGADVLRDAAGLARGDLRLADRVQQRRLAVVDVTHDRDHGRARLEILVGVLERRVRVRVVGRRDDLDLLVELVGDDLDRVVGQRLRERRHLAEAHQLLDDLRRRPTPRYSATSLTVEPELTRMTSAFSELSVLRDGLLVGAAAAPAAATARRAVRRTAAGAAAGPPPGPPPGPPDAQACESMTTRRTPPAEPGARSPCSEERVGRRWPGRRPLRRPRSGLGLAFGFGGVFGARFSARGARAVPWPKPARCWMHRRPAGFLAAPLAARLGLGLAGQRGVGELLVHGGRGSLHLEAVRVQALDDLRERHVVLLG